MNFFPFRLLRAVGNDFSFLLSSTFHRMDLHCKKSLPFSGIIFQSTFLQLFFYTFLFCFLVFSLAWLLHFMFRGASLCAFHHYSWWWKWTRTDWTREGGRIRAKRFSSLLFWSYAVTALASFAEMDFISFFIMIIWPRLASVNLKFIRVIAASTPISSKPLRFGPVSSFTPPVWLVFEVAWSEGIFEELLEGGAISVVSQVIDDGIHSSRKEEGVPGQEWKPGVGLASVVFAYHCIQNDRNVTGEVGTCCNGNSLGRLDVASQPSLRLKSRQVQLCSLRKRNKFW